MVNASLLPVTVVNDWTAKLWSKLLPKMQVHSDIAIGPGGAFGWAVRKDSPKLLADINEFIKTHRQGHCVRQSIGYEIHGVDVHVETSCLCRKHEAV